MNLIEDLQRMAQGQRESYERDNGKLPDDFEFTAERAKTEIERLTAQVEAMREALETIRDRDWTENALDPQWPAQVASTALAAHRGK